MLIPSSFHHYLDLPDQSKSPILTNNNNEYIHTISYPISIANEPQVPETNTVTIPLLIKTQRLRLIRHIESLQTYHRSNKTHTSRPHYYNKPNNNMDR